MFLKSLIIRFTCEKKAESYKIVCFSFNISKLGCGSATMTILVYIYIYIYIYTHTHTHTYIYTERKKCYFKKLDDATVKAVKSKICRVD